MAAPALVSAYIKWLDSKDQVNSGHWMTTALGRIVPGSAAESDAVKALIRSLDSEDGSIRHLAAESLGKIRQGGRGGRAETARAQGQRAVWHPDLHGCPHGDRRHIRALVRQEQERLTSEDDGDSHSVTDLVTGPLERPTRTGLKFFDRRSSS